MNLLLITRKSALVFALLFLVNSAGAQCTIIPNAVPNLSLPYSVAVNNATGVAYNPNFNLWYIAQAGNPGFPLETFDAAGTPLYQTNTGFDMRGLWWNANTNQLESNGYNTLGIWAYDLNASGYALNTGTSIFTGLNQPTSQSVGDYNCVDDEIWYYNAGSIMKRDRTTNALIGNFPITGLPVGTANLNNNTVFYTDCQGHEIGLVDYVLKRIYFVDKTTMAYTGFSQLPAGTVVSNAFRASWANGLVWLFDTGPDIWYSFEVLTGFNSNCTVVVCTPPSIITDDLTTCSPNTVDLNNGINAASAPGNGTFYNSYANADASTGAIGPVVGTSGWYYVRYEDPSDPTCYSVDSILVTINPIYNLNENVNACENSSYVYPDGFSEVITANSSHVSNLTTAAGCDSIITTNVTMDPLPDAGTNSPVTYCQSDPAADLYGVLGGTPDAGGTWSPVLTSGTGVFDPSVDAAGVYTYTVTNGCGTISADVTVTITNLVDAGTNGSISFCSSDPAADLYGSLGGTPDAGGTWSPALVSGTGVFDPAIDAAGTYTYTVSNSCGNASADVVVSLTVTPSAGTNGAITLCDSDPASDLYNSLGGSPDGGGTWSPALASGTGTFDPAVDPAGTYTYTVTNSCGSAMADVVVSVTASVDPGTNGSLTLCDNDPATDLYNSLGGSPNAGGTWSPALASGTGVFDPAVDAAGTYTYTATNSCGNASADVVVSVTISPDAGTNGTLTLCDSDPATDLYNSLGGSPDMGGTWSPALTSGTGMFDPAVDASGIYTYTVTNSCGTVTADVDVTVTAIPDPGTNGSITMCEFDPTTDLFNSLGGTPDMGGTWTPALASGTGVFNPAVDASGVYTYEFNTSCGVFSAQVTATVNPADDATFSYPSGLYCITDANPTATISGTPGGTFTAGGSGVVDPNTGEINISASGVGGFSVTYTTSGPCPDQFVYDISIMDVADATITPAGPFCADDGTVILQAADAGGTWSGPGVDPSTGEFDPAQANVGSNTITYTIGGPCGDVQNITIDVTAVPTVTTINDTIIEFGESIILTTNGSAPNYTWTPTVGLDCSDCQNPEASPEETTLYIVVNEENGCTASTTVLVTVLVDPVIWVPNIFSPNGDNHNDVLFVRGEGVRDLTFVVYDRWGERVFESTDMDDGWDGNFRGQPMNPAVFMYFVEATFTDGTTQSLKGDVTLVR